MQPSAQGIASVFMGNPGALAARVDQDRKQSPMGIPDDLRQLMALNIVTNETDAAKRQQAMNELQQMAPNGQPPTVAESLRQQAVQKLQSRMVQEQQKQQAMQQMLAGLPAAGIPPNVPQPQGIDQAPVEFGMASGGIVSFEGGGTVEERYRIESEEMGEGKRLRFSPDVQDYAKQLQAQANATQVEFANRERQRMLEESKAIAPRQAEMLGDPNKTRETMRRVGPMMAPRFDDPRLLQGSLVSSEPTPESPARPKTTGGIPDALMPKASPRIEPASIDQIATKAPEIVDPRLSQQGLRNMASAAELGETEKYGRLVGAPNTSALDKLMAEYERQKAATESPTGMAGLMEFMSQIASGARRGRTSMEAAAAGVTGTQALERERAAQRAALTEKQIGLEQQKLNAARDYAKELFGVGKSAFDKEFERNFNLYRDQGIDVRSAQDRAQQLTLEDIRYKHQVERDKEQHRYAMIQRGTPTAEMEREEKRIKMYMDEQKAKGNTVSYMDAVQAVRGLGGNAGLENAQTRMLREARKDIDDRLEQLQMAGQEKSQEYIQLSQQRKRLSDMIVGRVLKEAGVSGEPSGGVDKNNPLLK